MDSAALKVKESLVSLVKTGTWGVGPVPKVLERCALGALRNAGGGRFPAAGAEADLVQDFLLKVLARRKEMGVAALLAEWEPMAPAAFLVYVKKTLRNLAVETNPMWDLQRGLRDVVTAALEDGLPEASALPGTIDENGRYVRELVARACAACVAAGTTATVKALTTDLMDRYWVGELVVLRDAAREQETRRDDLMALRETEAAAREIANTYLREAGEAGRALFTLRQLGFQEMARRLGVALGTVHAWYRKAVERVAELARSFGFGHETVVRAIEVLKA